MHADEWHLYYNMTSLLWKGLQLESTLGSVRFLLLVCELWATSSAIICAVLWASHRCVGQIIPAIASQYYSLCVLGFSAVLFGFKAVINASEAGWQSVHVPMLGRLQTPPQVRSSRPCARICMQSARCCVFPLAVRKCNVWLYQDAHVGMCKNQTFCNSRAPACDCAVPRVGRARHHTIRKSSSFVPGTHLRHNRRCDVETFSCVRCREAQSGCAGFLQKLVCISFIRSIGESADCQRALHRFAGLLHVYGLSRLLQRRPGGQQTGQ